MLHLRSVLPQRLPSWACIPLTLLLVAALATSGSAQEPDRLGLYWDAAYTQDAINVAPVPGFVTGYLVLENASDPAGVLGWELCLDFQDRATLLATHYSGNAINVLSPPCFVVGLASPVPPVAGDVLLASFDLMVTDDRPLEVTAFPAPDPSVPGEMAWIPASRPGDLEPMLSATGSPVVATINAGNPWYEFDRTLIEYGTVAYGMTSVRTVTVTNAGLTNITMDIALSEGCEGFLLTDVQGTLLLPPGASQIIPVTFAPPAVGNYTCTLLVGPGLPGVTLQGEGREPISSHVVSSIRYFGEVGVGLHRDVSATFRNNGEVPLPITPQLSGCGAEYSIIAGGDPQVVAPGGLVIVNLRFEPATQGLFECFLTFGPEYDQVPLHGTGTELEVSWTVSGHLIFGEVPVGGFVDRTISVTNTGEAGIPLNVALDGCPADVTIITGAGAIDLPPGAARLVQVRFAPTAIVDVACSLNLGTVVPAEPISGSTRVGGFIIDAPDSVVLGPIEAGDVATAYVTVRNLDSVSFTLTPALASCGQEFALSNTAPRLLQPGATHTMQVAFLPQADGVWVCLLTLGDGLPAIVLQGIANPAVPRFEVAPSELVFAVTEPGETRQASVQVLNTGRVAFEITPSLSGDPEISIVAGGAPRSIAPGGVTSVTMLYAPQDYGTHAAVLDFGGIVTPVPVSGESADLVESCTVSPTSLSFGTVEVGTAAVRQVTVTNTGNVALNLTPTAGPSAYSVTPAGVTLAAGASRTFDVTFRPLGDGSFIGQVNFGHPACPTVSLTGQGEAPIVVGLNEVGIFFDADYTINSEIVTPFTPARAYLVLHEPSALSGVLGFECRIEMYGGQHFVLSWNLPDNSLNVATPPEFVVGIGGAPLPWARDILLMSYDFMVIDSSAIFFALWPTSVPTIPGQMAWVDGTGNTIFTMHPITNDPIVAVVNDSSPVALLAPAPVPERTAAGVELTWQPTVDSEAECLVYRRVGDGAAELRTDVPVAASGGSWRWTDDVTGLAPGTRLHYSYAVVEDGIELARSPEVELVLQGVPVLATRLLPNVPNPFNPETEIRFELLKPGRVRVTVHDVTGRRVRVLQDGHLGAGPWSRTWHGRDEAGRTVASGAYYVRLESTAGVDHRKIMLLK